MARLTNDELVMLIADHNPALAEQARRALAGKDATITSLVADVRSILPRVGLRNMTPDVLAALDRLRAAVRDMNKH